MGLPYKTLPGENLQKPWVVMVGTLGAGSRLAASPRNPPTFFTPNQQKNWGLASGRMPMSREVDF